MNPSAPPPPRHCNTPRSANPCTTNSRDRPSLQESRSPDQRRGNAAPSLLGTVATVLRGGCHLARCPTPWQAVKSVLPKDLTVVFATCHTLKGPAHSCRVRRDQGDKTPRSAASARGPVGRCGRAAWENGRLVGENELNSEQHRQIERDVSIPISFQGVRP